MHHLYADILSRIKEDPAWYDSNGVPRFGKFTPDSCPNIYAKEVCLLAIRCQSCHQQFKVELHMDLVQQMQFDSNVTLAGWIRGGTIHYGDPPRHDCAIGNAMNCDDLEVIEYWHRPKSEWIRDSSLEIILHRE